MGHNVDETRCLGSETSATGRTQIPSPMLTIHSLPNEILDLVLAWTIRMLREEKNRALGLRLVSRAFADGIKPYTSKTIQLDFSRCARIERYGSARSLESLKSLGSLTEALHVDMLLMRSKEEVDVLSHMFRFLPPEVTEMTALVARMRGYSMSGDTFDEDGLRMMLNRAISNTPNSTKFSLNLPFPMIGQASRAATLLLSITADELVKRPEEHRILETLSLQCISDTTLFDIFRNHMDLSNVFRVFGGLKQLVLSFRRQERRPQRQSLFGLHLWMLLEQASKLESLCIIGWNAPRRDRNHHESGLSEDAWNMKALPFDRDISGKLSQLRSLELSRVNLYGRSLVSLIYYLAPSLKELYLNDVHLKTRQQRDGVWHSLWVGVLASLAPNDYCARPNDSCWVAHELREMDELQLDVLRAKGLGYDDFEAEVSIASFDLGDLSALGLSLDQRFVQAVFGLPNHVSHLEKDDYDAEEFQKHHNTTSCFRKCIDGQFTNQNKNAREEFGKIVEALQAGIGYLSEERDRQNRDASLLLAPPVDAAAQAASEYNPALSDDASTPQII